MEGLFGAHLARRAPVLSAGVVGATGTRTVTRTLASTVPPSPLAYRWKLVEVEGETVWVPLTLTWPMPSMDGGAGVGGAPVEHDRLAKIDGERDRR